MPNAPTVPINENIQSTTSQAIDRLHIGTVRIVLVPGDSTQVKMEVAIRRGYDNAGVFVDVGKPKLVTLSGAALTTKMAETVGTGKSHYDDFKDALWALLESEGHVAAGTVS